MENVTAAAVGSAVSARGLRLRRRPVARRQTREERETDALRIKEKMADFDGDFRAVKQETLNL